MESGDFDDDGGSFAGRGGERDVATDGIGPFLHAAQAETDGGRRAGRGPIGDEPASVILKEDPQVPAMTPDREHRPLGLRVADDVGKGFLKESIEVDFGFRSQQAIEIPDVGLELDGR